MVAQTKRYWDEWQIAFEKRLEIVQSGIFNEQNVFGEKIQVLHIIDGKQLIKFVKNTNRENSWKNAEKPTEIEKIQKNWSLVAWRYEIQKFYVNVFNL